MIVNPQESGLRAVGVQLPLRTYLEEVWRRRDLAVVIPVESFRMRYAQTVLGSTWHFLSPLLMVAVYWLIFGVLLDINRGVPNALSFLAVGIFVYRYSQNVIMAGARSVTGNMGLVRSIYFPRLVLPIQSTVEGLLDFLASTVVMLAFVVASGDPVRLSWLWFPLFIVLITGFSFGGALTAARLNTIAQDFQNLLPTVFRVFFYASGVIFPVDLRVESETLRSLFVLNPFYAFLTLGRTIVLGYSFNPATLYSAAVWTLSLLVFGFWFFRKGEKGYGL